MKPSDREYDFLASQLSEDLATEEQQLEALGAEIFSTAQLIELRGRFRERLENFDFFQQNVLKIAIWSPAFLLVGGGLFWLKVYRLGMFLLVAFPIVLAVCLVGVFLIYQNFGRRGRMEHWLELVEDELKKRKAITLGTVK